MNRTAFPAFPALAGVLAVASGAAVAELVAALIGRPQAGTVVVVGSVLVDAAPTPVKEFAVATLGTADKPVLLGGIGVVLAVLAAGLGIVACRNRAAGLGRGGRAGPRGHGRGTDPPGGADRRRTAVAGRDAGDRGRAAAAPACPAARRHRANAAFGRSDLPDAAFAHRDAGRRARRARRPGAGVDRRAFLGAAALVAAGAAAAGGAPPCSAGRRAPPRSVSRCACPRRPSPHRRCLPGSIRAS